MEGTKKMCAKVIGYIPLDTGSPAKTRISLLLDVNRTKNGTDRLKKLIAITAVFNHHDKVKHDHDIRAGAVAIVCNIFRSCSPFFTTKSKEVACLCQILLHLYRCTDERAKASFCLDGSTLIINLFEVIEINYRLGKKGDKKCLLLAQSLIEKLITIACIPLLMVKRHEELLSSLISTINGASGKIVIHQSMRCLARLSEHLHNKQLLLAYPGLLNSLDVGSRHMFEAVREESARILCNLAWETRNRAQLAKRHNHDWIDSTFTIMTASNSSITMKTYVMKIFSYMSSEIENKVMIVNYKNGAVIRELLHISSINQVDISPTMILCNLVCRATASFLGKYPGFLITLSSLACCDHRIAISAAFVVKKLATHLHSDDSSHCDLLQALTTMSYATMTEVVKLCIKAFKGELIEINSLYYLSFCPHSMFFYDNHFNIEQAASPHDRVNMIAHKGILPVLSMLAQDDNVVVRTNAQSVLNTLATDVAVTMDLNVDEVIQCVQSQDQSRKRHQPRCYSPKAVMNFDYDIEFNSA